MSTTLGIVEVGSIIASAEASNSGSRAGRRLGGRSILEWVVRRVTDSHGLKQVVVVADQRDPRRHRINDLVPSDIPIYFGKQTDPLGRFAGAVKKYHADAVVRVSVDHPFVDPALIDRLLSVASHDQESEYICFANSLNDRIAASRLGLFAEWCRADAIYRADRDATDSRDRCEATRFIYTHPELYQLRILPAPAALDRDDLRLAILSEDDWEHAEAILEALGPEGLEWQRIAGLLDHQPQIRQRMAHLNRCESV